MHHTTWVAVAAAGLLFTTGLAADATAGRAADGDRRHGYCERSFDRAQRTDMESFRDFDAETWREGHADDAISIFPTGEMHVGIEEIMAAAERHFTKKDAVWSWDELSRRVEGCRSAMIVYDATYDIPAFDYHQRALTTVTYVFQHGHWKSVMDQGTLLELSRA
ncbi:MAG TPA: DUF4440 domain-containing protein [Actinophytocola sp.]|nr:DUF4440 domain-containing protein [Actinophytocola sp.]